MTTQRKSTDMADYNPKKDILCGEARVAYLMEHLEASRKKLRCNDLFASEHMGLFKVVKPMHAFKKAMVSPYHGGMGVCIVNLRIPEGAYVIGNVDEGYPTLNSHTRKFRANVAQVHSIFSTKKSKERLPIAFSSHDPRFEYRPANVIAPESGFDFTNEICSSGIHFFIDLIDALNYAF